MPPAPDIVPMPSPFLENEAADSLLVGIGKCLATGFVVGAAGIPLCFLGGLLFCELRDLGIFLLMALIPVGGFFAWFSAGRYLARESNRLRGAIAYGTKYFFLGAFFGFIFAGCDCNIAPSTFVLGAIGTIIGSFGGAFQGWLDSRKSGQSVGTVEKDHKDTKDSESPCKP